MRSISVEGSMETYQNKDSLSPAWWLSACHPLLNNMTDIYFIRTSTVWEKLYDSSKTQHNTTKKPTHTSIPADPLNLQTFCSFSQVACFFLSRISNKLTNFGGWLWKSGITIANFIPLKFTHSSYKWGRFYFWDVNQGLFPRPPKYPLILSHVPHRISSICCLRKKRTSHKPEDNSNPWLLIFHRRDQG